MRASPAKARSSARRQASPSCEFAATKLVLEDSEAVRLILKIVVKALTRDNTALTSDNANLRDELNSALENSDPDLSESIASAAALNEKAAKAKVKREPEEGDQQGGAKGTLSSKRAKK